jgi:hypothetical protein
MHIVKADGVIERARSYIAAVRWQNAKTYEDFAPHEYTMRKWNTELNQECIWFCKLIQSAGVKEKFMGTTYRYLYVDNHRYWTIGPGMFLINRCPADQDHDNPTGKPKRPIGYEEILIDGAE